MIQLLSRRDIENHQKRGPVGKVGLVASPLLANVYLHCVYGGWVEQWRTRHATGDMIVVGMPTTQSLDSSTGKMRSVS
jgi:hypothetical protein